MKFRVDRDGERWLRSDDIDAAIAQHEGVAVRLPKGVARIDAVDGSFAMVRCWRPPVTSEIEGVDLRLQVTSEIDRYAWNQRAALVRDDASVGLDAKMRTHRSMHVATSMFVDRHHRASGRCERIRCLRVRGEGFCISDDAERKLRFVDLDCAITQ